MSARPASIKETIDATVDIDSSFSHINILYNQIEYFSTIRLRRK